jgi:hypothetical protein
MGKKKTIVVMNRILAVVSFVVMVVAILWFISDGGYEPLITLIAGVAGLITSLRDHFDKSNKEETSNKSKHTDCLVVLADTFASEIGAWFAEQFSTFQRFASEEELKSQSREQHLEALMRFNSEVSDYKGGLYTLDNDGHVIAQFTPECPDMPPVTGSRAHTDYFLDCVSKKKPIVCNAMDSAQRNQKILVIAAPRYDTSGIFAGILDGVMDIASAPFSTIAKSTVHDVASKSSVLSAKAVRLVLFDGKHQILGSNDESLQDSRNASADEKLASALASRKQGVMESGANWASASVEGTPLFCVAYLANVASH